MKVISKSIFPFNNGFAMDSYYRYGKEKISLRVFVESDSGQRGRATGYVLTEQNGWKEVYIAWDNLQCAGIFNYKQEVTPFIEESFEKDTKMVQEKTAQLLGIVSYE